MWRGLQGGEQVQLHQVQHPLLQRHHLQPGNGGDLLVNYVDLTFFLFYCRLATGGTWLTAKAQKSTISARLDMIPFYILFHIHENG